MATSNNPPQLAAGQRVPVRNERQVFASINIMMLRSAVSVDEAVKQFLKPLE